MLTAMQWVKKGNFEQKALMSLPSCTKSAARSRCTNGLILHPSRHYFGPSRRRHTHVRQLVFSFMAAPSFYYYLFFTCGSPQKIISCHAILANGKVIQLWFSRCCDRHIQEAWWKFCESYIRRLGYFQKTKLTLKLLHLVAADQR